jgi:hypothetical protein
LASTVKAYIGGVDVSRDLTFSQSYGGPSTVTVGLTGDFDPKPGERWELVFTRPAVLPRWRAWAYRVFARWLTWPIEEFQREWMIVEQVTLGHRSEVTLVGAAWWDLAHTIVAEPRP